MLQAVCPFVQSNGIRLYISLMPFSFTAKRCTWQVRDSVTEKGMQPERMGVLTTEYFTTKLISMLKTYNCMDDFEHPKKRITAGHIGATWIVGMLHVLRSATGSPHPLVACYLHLWPQSSKLAIRCIGQYHATCLSLPDHNTSANDHLLVHPKVVVKQVWSNHPNPSLSLS